MGPGSNNIVGFASLCFAKHTLTACALVHAVDLLAIVEAKSFSMAPRSPPFGKRHYFPCACGPLPHLLCIMVLQRIRSGPLVQVFSSQHRAFSSGGRRRWFACCRSGGTPALPLTNRSVPVRGNSSHRASRAAVNTTTRADVAFQTEEPQTPTAVSNSKSVAAVILGGGAGTRLYPLTKSRAKPAVPIGGAYRLIDVPMSNCLNSGISKMYILTQFNSASLNRHLARTYNFGNGIMYGGNGFVEVLAATQTPGLGGKEWFQGTADAVRQYAWLFEDVKNKDVQDIVILSGDHLYRMVSLKPCTCFQFSDHATTPLSSHSLVRQDYMAFVDCHRAVNADITIGCLPMDDVRASDFGLMKIDNTGRITEFAEKPKGDALQAMQVDTTILGLTSNEAKASPYIASMGIYVFKKAALVSFLNTEYPKDNDFGGEIIPKAAADGYHVQAYLFNGYWEDIGTIKSFFEANLALAKNPPQFEFYDARAPIYTSPRFLPPAKIEKCHVKDAIISHGCSLADCSVEDSIVGLRSQVGKGCTIKHAMVIGADFYESAEQKAKVVASGGVPVGIGDGCTISNAIIDKNARIGKNCTITNATGTEEFEDEENGVYIRSGIVTILRNASIPDGTII